MPAKTSPEPAVAKQALPVGLIQERELRIVTTVPVPLSTVMAPV